MTQKVHVSLDDNTLNLIDRWASREGRTRSGVIREMARAYEEHQKANLSRAEAKARALKVLEELAGADFGADDLPEPEDFPTWREQLWAGMPRTGAQDE
jgi:Arc/MetJ-type ribon-helix-helix transcriptional regulator